MKIPFHKLHGAKNDFLLSFAADVPLTDFEATAIAICNRYTGVGADGWMLVDPTAGSDPASDPDAGSDFDASIRLFNSDGSEPELSGNGTRCAAALLSLSSPDAVTFRIRTGAGIKPLRLISRQGLEWQFEMNMGRIRILELHASVQGHDAVLVDTGNPQCAMPVEDFHPDWQTLGARIEHDARFPNHTNVSFIRPIDRHTLEVRFWERGAGETNSSGTGSTGAACAAIARGFAESPVTVLTPAGPLVLRIEDAAYLIGPAAYIADGVFHM
jgi:diaminopimelate epimerase